MFKTMIRRFLKVLSLMVQNVCVAYRILAGNTNKILNDMIFSFFFDAVQILRVGTEIATIEILHFHFCCL